MILGIETVLRNNHIRKDESRILMLREISSRLFYVILCFCKNVYFSIKYFEKMCKNAMKNVQKCVMLNSGDIQKPEHAIRFSKRGYRKEGQITNIPLYLASKTKELL